MLEFIRCVKMFGLVFKWYTSNVYRIYFMLSFHFFGFLIGNIYYAFRYVFFFLFFPVYTYILHINIGVFQ